jgi:hypothetical protein
LLSVEFDGCMSTAVADEGTSSGKEAVGGADVEKEVGWEKGNGTVESMSGYTEEGRGS